MFKRLYLAWKVLNSGTLIVITDDITHIEVPYMDPLNFNNILLLSAQQASLEKLLTNVDQLIQEHGMAVERMLRNDENAPQSETQDNTKEGR